MNKSSVRKVYGSTDALRSLLRMQLSNHKCVFILAISVGAAGCNSTPVQTEAPPLVQRDAIWVAMLTTQPEDDINRLCVRSALQTALGMLAFKEGGFNDDYIRRSLIDTVSDTKMRARRKAENAEWERTHEPSMVSAVHLMLCMSENGNALPVSDLWARCFLAIEPTALLSIYRRSGQSLSVAVQAVTPYYPIDTNASSIAELGRFVFDMVSDAEDLKFREDLFIDCVADGR